MPLPNVYFNDFLQAIRLTATQRQDARDGHTRLRDRLAGDEDLSPRIISTFLQGSYKRSTSLRPQSGGRSDVDIVVVTDLHEDSYSPQEALGLFVPFLEKHYQGKYRPQGRSFGIELSNVELDLVVTSAPSEAQLEALAALEATENFTLLEALSTPSLLALTEAFRANAAEWKQEPLRIPNRETETWEDTHPLVQIAWTVQKNADCNGHYVNVVKAIKWWQRCNSGTIQRPKGYPLEHLVGDNCPDGIQSVEEGVALTLRAMVDNYRHHADDGSVPASSDRGTSSNVMERISAEDFAAFYAELQSAADLADAAFAETDICLSVQKWRELFGSKFPKPPSHCEDTKEAGFSERVAKTSIHGQRFA